MPLPAAGVPAADVLHDLDALRVRDVDWRNGRAFTLVYHAGPEVLGVAEEAYRILGAENALNTDAFPSLRQVQAEVIDVASRWLGAPDGAAGFMTSGGTESLLMAVLAARERGRRERGVAQPNIVLPASAHAAFEKGCHYFGVESRRIPVRADWRADVGAMAAAIDEDTVLVVASAPQYPQGVVDDVPGIAALAEARGINCHVDACMGGVVLHYLRRLGEPVPPWDFAVPGVTSMSVDLHKFGYTAKGASVIVHRSKQLRADQTFVTDNWLGGTYGSSGVLGTKGGGAMAAAWAVVRTIGDDGYLRLTAAARRAALQLAQAIRAIPELRLLADPDTMLVTFRAADDAPVDVAALAGALWRRGWYVDRQGPPASLHCTVNAVHEGRIDEFVADLRAALDEVRTAAPTGTERAYGTIE